MMIRKIINIPIGYSILFVCFLVMAPCALHAQIGEVEILTLVKGESRAEDKKTGISGLLVDTTRGKVLCLINTDETDLPVTDDAYMGSAINPGKLSSYFAIYDPDFTEILYATYLGGTDNDIAYSLSWDESGAHVLISGSTRSPDFPVTADARQPELNGPKDFWYARFDMDRHEFTYITYLGGNGYEALGILTITNDRRMLVSGYTSSIGLPIGQGKFGRQPDINGDATVFVLRDDSLLYAVSFGGKSDESVQYIIETEDSFVLTGLTWSSDFPVTDNAFQPSFGGVEDVFILRTDKEFRSIEYCSYIGGISNERLQKVKYIDERVHIVGQVFGVERYPLTHESYGYDTVGYWSGFYTIYDPESDMVLFSSLIRGHNAESINDLMALDEDRVLLFVSSNSDTLLGMVKDIPGDWNTMMQLLIEFDLVEMQPRKMQLLWNNGLSLNAGGAIPTGYGIYFRALTNRQLPVQPSGVQTEYVSGFEPLVARLHLHETTRAAPLPERSSMVSLVPYPNPSSGPATVLLAAPPGSYTLHLYGSDGRLHRMHTVDHAGTSASSTSLPLAGLAAGQYQLIAIDSHGAPVARSGLVIW